MHFASTEVSNAPLGFCKTLDVVQGVVRLVLCQCTTWNKSLETSRGGDLARTTTIESWHVLLPDESLSSNSMVPCSRIECHAPRARHSLKRIWHYSRIKENDKQKHQEVSTESSCDLSICSVFLKLLILQFNQTINLSMVTRLSS